MPLDRRSFLRTAGGAGLALAGSSASSAAGLPDPQESGIDHIVVVTMENRSFDHYLGWLSGADGKQAGLTYLDKSNVPHSTHPLAPDFTGCGFSDPDHSYDQSRVAYDGGAMDGFLRAGNNDIFSAGYYTAADLPFLAAAARRFTVCDRFFASILGPTFSNRMFIWAAQTDRLADTVSFTSLPTIFDRLTAAGVSHRYYFNNVPYLLLWGLKYLLSSSPISTFKLQALTGTLPAVSFIDPTFTITDDGSGTDDHPHADIRNGENFLASIYYALATGPHWKNTVMVIQFDEWGGFFEHVAPPRAIAANNVDTDQVNGQTLLGFRVPAIVISPFARNPRLAPLVNHTVFDHTSVLKMIEWRWGLPPLTPRDALATNLARVLNFDSPDSSVPLLPYPPKVTAPACPGGGILDTSISAISAAGSSTTAWGKLAATPTANQWRQFFKLP